MAHFCETWNSPVNTFNDPEWDASWVEKQGGFSMVGQQLWPASCNFPNKMHWAGNTDTNDQVISFQIVNLDIDLAGGTYVSACLRITEMVSPNRNYYTCTIGQLFSPAVYAEIGKFVGNTFTQIASTTLSGSPDGKRLKARVTGNLIELLLDDVLILSATDTDLPTSSRVGIEMGQSCSLPFGGLVIDTAFGGDVADEDQECVCLDNCVEPPPPPVEVNTGVPADCGHAFAPNPCPSGCGKPSFLSINPRALAPSEMTMGWLDALFPLDLVSGSMAAGRVGVPADCGHAFANDLTTTGDCR